MAWLERKPEVIVEVTDDRVRSLRSRGTRRGRSQSSDTGAAERASTWTRSTLLGGRSLRSCEAIGRGAAEAWAEAGCPYQAALALAEGDDDALARRSRRAESLGSQARRRHGRAAHARARARRDAGAAASTRDSRAGLTRRETEVLELLAEGLRNAEIADRLFLSPRTIDHHVSAILGKLDARTRGEAVAAATRLELLEDR